MRIAVTMIIVLFSNLLLGQTSLEEVRENYVKAVSDKKICKQMIAELQLEPHSPIVLGYLGGFQAIWANHIFSPMAKLKTFNKGKANLEKSILQDPNNAELRYIRLSIQKNTPGILGYKNMIEKDTEFLQLHKKEIGSSLVLKNLESLLKL